MGSLNIARSLPGADPTCQHRSPNWKHPQNPNLQQNEAPQWFDCCNKKNEKKKGGGSQGEKNWRPFLILQDTTKKDVHHTMLPIPIAHGVGRSCLLNVSSSKKTSET